MAGSNVPIKNLGKELKEAADYFHDIKHDRAINDIIANLSLACKDAASKGEYFYTFSHEKFKIPKVLNSVTNYFINNDCKVIHNKNRDQWIDSLASVASITIEWR